MKNQLLFILYFLIVSIIPSYADDGMNTPIVDKGVLNLSEVDFDKIKEVKLEGLWEFYWNTFLYPEDFQNGKSSKKPEYLMVPQSWTFRTSHRASGFATYRIIIEGLKSDSLYSLYIPELFTNYRFWVDGKEMAGNGVVSHIAEESLPQSLPKMISFETQKKSVEIMIQISNFNYRKSGILRNLYLGKQDNIRFYRESRIMLDTFLSAILLSISLFHIGIFIYRKKEKTEFLFGLICLTFLIRIITTGEQILTLFIPKIPWEIVRRLEYIPFYLSAPLLALFFTSLFPGEISKFFNKLYIGTCALLGIFILIFPIRISNHLILFAQIIMLIGILYTFNTMVKAMIRKREGSFLFMIAYIIFTSVVVNDILFANQIIQTMYVTPLGFVIFIIMQSQILTRKVTQSFTQREILAQSRDKFRYASITDSLTGLYNVRYLQQSLEKEMLHSIESGNPLSVIMADVDNFKNYNDTWGHKQGDEVLKKIAEIIKKSAREHDSPCRYGGEEFSVILPATSLADAAEVSERIRLRFEMAEDTDERMHGITVSIGVAQFKEGETADNIIERADRALYVAKENGKNRVELG
ncbi:MAG: GGDEF domain-containing protein [Spirochaetaceae bacterium]|jgi:diguanylate cyclase (GGDEF)-like protein|nr:GGDEF domain-containing protein [Spirochaetaceae bacterium]